MNTTDWKGKLVWVVIGIILGTIIGMWVGYTLGMRTGEKAASTTLPAGSVTSTNGTGTSSANTSTDSTSQTGALIGVTNPVIGDSDLISVNAQSAGYTVTIAHVVLSANGWVAVHEVINGDVIGNILGAARRDAGSYDSVAVELLRSTEAGKSYAAILYQDNGNKEFDLSADLPLIDANGNPIVKRFSVSPNTSPSGL